MVDWKSALPLLKDDSWKYIVFDDFEGDNFSYIKKHYKSLLAGANDKITITDKYLKKISIEMKYRPSIVILNRYPDWSDCDIPWIEANCVTFLVNEPLIN